MSIRFPRLSSSPYSQKSPTTTATALVSSIDEARKSLQISNIGAVDCYIAPDASVASNNGFLLVAGATVFYDREDGFAKWRWYGRTASGTATLFVMEGVE